MTDIRDPDDQGRVKVALPWLPDPHGQRYEAWARLATLMAGNGRGTWFIPDVNDEVLVAFEAGDPDRPFVVGALWNGQDAPPEQMDGAGSNHRKTIRSRRGVSIEMSDVEGKESLRLETPDGMTIEMEGGGPLKIDDGRGNVITMKDREITIQASEKLRIVASRAEVSASKLVVNAAASEFHGQVKCDTLVTTTCVAAAYTPGAGNIW